MNSIFEIKSKYPIISMLLLLFYFQPAFSTPTTPTSDFIINKDGTVTHKTTGLTWMRCAMGQKWTGSTCSGSTSIYSYDQAIVLTRTFAGHNDWRLPNIAELHTIVERESHSPAINTALFPNTLNDYFWSSSPYAYDSELAWIVHFNYGSDYYDYDRYNSHAVRLVRGGQPFYFLPFTTPTSDFTDNQNGTVTHKRAGLIWQRCAIGQLWTGSTCSGSASTYTYDQALALTSAFAGYNDWRVPNQNELLSIVEYGTNSSAINTMLFPNTPDLFWSSSSFTTHTAWITHFSNGDISFGNKSDTYTVRLVRGEQLPVPTEKHAVLLLHGMNSDLKTWNNLVEDDNGFDRHCTNTTPARAADFANTDPVANTEGVYCFRMNFGILDRLSSAPTGLDGKSCLQNRGCSGDYSTFESLGTEVDKAINKIKSKLGNNTKIILLGHSRGGLAARAFLQKPISSENKNSVVGLITTGTPHMGSPLGRYYFYLNDNCTPESEHYQHNSNDACYRDWLFVNTIKNLAGLDIKAPAIGLLAEDSDDFKNSNPSAIKELNHNIGNLPDIKYTQIFYKGMKFGCLGRNSGSPEICGLDIFSNPRHPSQKGLNVILHDRERNSLDGDGIVPELNQKISEVVGFPFSSLLVTNFTNDVNDGGLVIPNNPNGKRVHLAETDHVFNLSKALTDMYKSLQWIH